MNNESESINGLIENMTKSVGDIQYLIYNNIPTMCSDLNALNNQLVVSNPIETIINDLEGNPEIGGLVTLLGSISASLGALAGMSILKSLKDFKISKFLEKLKKLLNRHTTGSDAGSGTSDGTGSNTAGGTSVRTETHTEDGNSESGFGHGTDEDPRKIICECHCECHCGSQGGTAGDGSENGEQNKGNGVNSTESDINQYEDSLDSAMLMTTEFSNVVDSTLLKTYLYAREMSPKIGKEFSAPLVKSCSTVEVALGELNKDSKVQLNDIGNNITSENKKILASNTLLNKDLLDNTTKFNKELLKNYDSFYSGLTLETSKSLSGVGLLYKNLENSINKEVVAGGKKINVSNESSLESYLENTESYLGKLLSDWKSNTTSIDGVVSKSGKKISAVTRSNMSVTVGEVLTGLATIAALLSPFGIKVVDHVNSIGETSKSSVHSSLNEISSSMNVFNGKTLGTVNGLGKGIASSISASTPSWSSAFNGGLKGMENDATSWGNRMERYFEGFSSRVGSIIRDIGADLSQARTDLTQGNNIEDKMQQDINLSNGGLGDMTFDGAFLAVPSESTWDHSRLRKISGSSMFGGNADGAVNVVINSPKALNPFEVRRQLEQTSRNMANGFY